MSDFSLAMSRGDTRTIVVTATYPEAVADQGIAAGDPLPLADKTVYFTAKPTLSADDDSLALFKKTTGSGITVRADPDDHICDVDIETEDTESVKSTKTFYCDCRVADGIGNLWTVAEGKLTVVENTTRETT